MKYGYLFLSVILLLVSSCVKDIERHELTPVTYGSLLYGDQTNDTIAFVTFDSWSAKNTTDWLELLTTSQNIKYDPNTRLLCKIPYMVKLNTTGKVRFAEVDIVSNGYKFPFTCVQFPYLNITTPAPKTEIKNKLNEQFADSVSWTFDLKDLSNRPAIEFYAHTSSISLQLAPGYESTDWIHIRSYNVVEDFESTRFISWPFDVDSNDGEVDREARLLLKSGVVSAIINVKQKAKPVVE